jgi:hypothetical protein
MNVVYELAERGFIIFLRKFAASWGVPKSMISLMVFTIVIMKMIHWVIKTTVPIVTHFVRKHVTSHPLVTAYLDEVLYAMSIIFCGLKLKTMFYSFLEVNAIMKTYKKYTANANKQKEVYISLLSKNDELNSTLSGLKKVEKQFDGDIKRRQKFLGRINGDIKIRQEFLGCINDSIKNANQVQQALIGDIERLIA